jgi:hypothetical protein
MPTEMVLLNRVPENPELIPAGLAKTIRSDLARVEDVAVVEEGRRRLAALRAYVTRREHKDECQEAERWCELRIGELLGKGERGRPSRQSQENSVATELKISKDDRHEFRLLAQHKRDVAKWIEGGCRSRAGLLAKISGKTRAAEERTPQGVRDGDFREVLEDVPDGTVDLILTDPPYAREHVGLWGDLGRFAARKLREGGSLVAYSGQAMLPEVFDLLRPHLRFWWVIALIHKHGGQQLPGKWVIAEWKPIVWFVKGGREGRKYLSDTLSGCKPRKEEHEWAQGELEAVHLIEQLTEEGALVVDPFSGSGTVALAAAGTGRRFAGAEIARRQNHAG